MIVNAKLHELLAFSAPTAWVPMANYRQVIAECRVAVASPETDVTVQLRKATDDQGSDADDLGAAVTTGTQAIAHAFASDLGKTSGGVPFTHVSAVITGAGSPLVESDGVVVRGDGRFSES
jgi:hypothetical protein